MNTNFDKMVVWEQQKAAFLLSSALQLGMQIDGYGELSVNNSSGYTYLWLEDYPFTLAMPIHCDLIKNDVIVLWTNFDNGEEEEESLSAFSSVEDIFNWVEQLNENCL
jgi:hypothetical protein